MGCIPRALVIWDRQQGEELAVMLSLSLLLQGSPGRANLPYFILPNKTAFPACAGAVMLVLHTHNASDVATPAPAARSGGLGAEGGRWHGKRGHGDPP